MLLLRLQILSTGQFLHLNDKALTVDIVSTLFQGRSSFGGSIQYPGTMPDKVNRAALQNAHLITSDTGLRTIAVRMWLGFTPWKIARMNFQYSQDGAGTNEISYMLYIDTSIISNRLKNTTLNQLVDENYEQISFNSAAEYKAFMMATVTAKPGTYPVVFAPYKNDGAYATIDPDDYHLYPDLALPVNPYINDWAIDSTGAGSFKVDDYFNPQKETQTPFYSVPYILKRLAAYFGFRVVGEWPDSEEANRIYMYSSIPNYGPLFINDFALSMPSIACDVALIELRTRLGLLIDFDQISNICYIESIDNLINSDNEIDLRDRQLTYFNDLVTTLRSYTIRQSVDDGDAAFNDVEKDALPVMQIGDLNTAIETDDFTLESVVTKMIIEVSPSSAQSSLWRVPYIKQQLYGIPPFNGITELGYDDKTKFKMRLLYYHGMKENDAGYLYPYMSADNLDLTGKPLTNYSLAIDATGSAIVAMKQYYELMKNSKPFEQGLKLTAREFFNINSRTKLVLSDRNGATVKCLLDQVSADFQVGDYIFAKASVYPILRPVNSLPVNPDNGNVIIPPVDNGTVYIKLVKKNTKTVNEQYPPPPRHGVVTDIYVQFFSDSAGITPKTVTDLVVRLKQSRTTSQNGTPENSIFTFTCNDTETLLLGGAITSMMQYYQEARTYTLVESSHYTIIT